MAKNSGNGGDEGILPTTVGQRFQEEQDRLRRAATPIRTPRGNRHVLLTDGEGTLESFVDIQRRRMGLSPLPARKTEDLPPSNPLDGLSELDLYSKMRFRPHYDLNNRKGSPILTEGAMISYRSGTNIPLMTQRGDKSPEKIGEAWIHFERENKRETRGIFRGLYKTIIRGFGGYNKSSVVGFSVPFLFRGFLNRETEVVINPPFSYKEAELEGNRILGPYCELTSKEGMLRSFTFEELFDFMTRPANFRTTEQALEARADSRSRRSPFE